MTFKHLVRLPSAYLPIICSIGALVTVLLSVTMFGVTHGGDEGTSAHIFQLLIAAQFPLVAFFAVKWLPRAAGPAARVLVLQFATAIIALAPVYILKL